MPFKSANATRVSRTWTLSKSKLHLFKFDRSNCISWLALLAHLHTNAQIRKISLIFLYFLPVPVASVVRIFTSLSMSIGYKTPNCICTNRFCSLTCNATFLCNNFYDLFIRRFDLCTVYIYRFCAYASCIPTLIFVLNRYLTLKRC